MRTVVFISCVSKKLPRPARAQDLYISPLFKLNLVYAKRLKPDKIFILSARHGLLGLNDRIAPYDTTLNQLHRWANKLPLFEFPFDESRIPKNGIYLLFQKGERSIFRKNIGRCLLNKRKDPFLKLWEIDLTPKAARDLHGKKVDAIKKERLEKGISKYLQDNGEPLNAQDFVYLQNI